MVIRHADPVRDGVACAAIYAPFVTDSAVSFEEVPPDAAEFTRRIQATSAEYPWLVADAAGEVAGYAYASRHRARAAYRWTAEVAVYTAAEHRRRGVGSALYGTLFELLARQGLHTVCAGVTLPNDASVALHEACGFTPVGVFRRVGFKQGEWRDVGWWQLELASADGGPPADPGPPVRLVPPP
jgi:phosphinothricin acetyltransferase